jgi:LPXTG-site transpeptidase (sortase) family protein
MIMIQNIFSKIRNNFKNVAGYAILALAFFAVLFYMVNWNLTPNPKANTGACSSFAGSLDDEILKKLGSTDISFMSYQGWMTQYGLTTLNGKPDDDPDSDGLPNYLEYVHGTNPIKADTDGDGFSDKQEIANGYDPDAPGDARPVVEITSVKMNITAPMVWSNSENEQDQLADLANGVAHFAKTSAPGQAGNMIVSGHSSNYVWAKGNFNHIFEKLNDLAPGDVIDVKTVQQNGRILTYHYRVSEKFVTVPNDSRIFESTDSASLTLSTCWPLGTNLRRLIVKAEMAR